MTRLFGCRVCTLALAMSVASPAHAAEPLSPGSTATGVELAPSAPGVITLDAAVARALDVGVDAESARLAVALARATRDLRTRAWQPDLSLNLSVEGNLGRTFSESLGTNVTDPAAQAGARVTSTLPIWSAGERLAQTRAAQADLDAATATLDQTRQDLVYALATGLLDAEQARAAVALAEARLRAEEALAARVDALIAAGARTRADGLSQAAAVAEARGVLVEARTLARTTDLAITELLRLESGLTWSFAVPATPPLELAGPSDAVRAALSARPALAAYVRSVDAVEAQVSAARAGGLPSVGLTVGAGTSWSTSRPAAFDAQLADQAAAWATVDLNVPILDRGVTRAAVERARLSVRQAVLASESARESVEVATRGAWAEREAAIEAAAAATLRRDAGAAAEAIVRERYEAGAVTFSELLVARAALADADERAITARADVDRASWTLVWVVGGL
jgi:outer membrane protein